MFVTDIAVLQQNPKMLEIHCDKQMTARCELAINNAPTIVRHGSGGPRIFDLRLQQTNFSQTMRKLCSKILHAKASPFDVAKRIFVWVCCYKATYVRCH
jgi:hypothetical protein